MIYLWSGIAETRIGKKIEGKKHIEVSLKYFSYALSINPNKIEFLNHKVVALQQLYDLISGDTKETAASKAIKDSVTKDIEDTFNNMFRIDLNYYKGYLNHASFDIRVMREKLKLPNLSSFPNYNMYSFDSPEKFYDYEKSLNDALKEIEKCKEINPGFVNSYFKSAEALTLKIWLYKKSERDYNKIVDECCINLETAQELHYNHLSTLYCKVAFLYLIEQTTMAEATKKTIEELKSNSP